MGTVEDTERPLRIPMWAGSAQNSVPLDQSVISALLSSLDKEQREGRGGCATQAVRRLELVD